MTLANFTNLCMNDEREKALKLFNESNFSIGDLCVLSLKLVRQNKLLTCLWLNTLFTCNRIIYAFMEERTDEEIILIMLKEFTGRNPEFNFGEIHDMFMSGCCNGQLKVLKYLYDNYYVNVNLLDDMLFCRACENKHSNICEWLLSINDKIKIKNCTNSTHVH